MNFAPDKKAKAYALKERFYKVSFYVIEALWILVVIPLIIFVCFITFSTVWRMIKPENSTWPIYLIVISIVFFQLLAVQDFIRRYINKNYGMTVGQWIRWKFNPTERAKRKATKNTSTQKLDTWYQKVNQIKTDIEDLETKEAYDNWIDWVGEEGDPYKGIKITKEKFARKKL